jgi:hypothetical protein
MNDLVKDLLKQSTYEILGVPQVDQKKFAELIVRECVKVMYDNAIERKVPPDINQTPTHYAIAVLEHFGVEE